MVKALKILYDLFNIPIKWLDGVYKCNITSFQFYFRLKWPKLYLLSNMSIKLVFGAKIQIALI